MILLIQNIIRRLDEPLDTLPQEIGDKSAFKTRNDEIDEHDCQLSYGEAKDLDPVQPRGACEDVHVFHSSGESLSSWDLSCTFTYACVA